MLFIRCHSLQVLYRLGCRQLMHPERLKSPNIIINLLLGMLSGLNAMLLRQYAICVFSTMFCTMQPSFTPFCSGIGRREKNAAFIAHVPASVVMVVISVVDRVLPGVVSAWVLDSTRESVLDSMSWVEDSVNWVEDSVGWVVDSVSWVVDSESWLVDSVS